MPNPGFIGWGGPTPFSGSLIQRVSVTAVVATIQFTQIPQAFSALRLDIVGRGDVASNNTDLQLQLNGDTGSTQYNWGSIGATNAAQGAESLSQAFIKLGPLVGASATAGRASYSRVMIPAYTNAVFHKGVMSLIAMSVTDGSTGTQEYLHGGVWKSTAPITSILLKLASGNFAAGTEVRLYGE